MNDKNIRHKSKFLSLILRHQPEKIGLELDKNGWADIDDLIAKSIQHKVYFDLEILDEVVRTNNKKRFTFNEDKTRIRANQGHSIDIDIQLKPLRPPAILYHGTARRNLDSILASGIDKRSRQHVHLSHELGTAHNVGSRHGKPIILHIDAQRMHADGCLFYFSKNEVWLTDFIDPKYIIPS